MTSMEKLMDNLAKDEKNVEISKKPVVDNLMKTFSKPFDVRAKDEAKMAADKIATAAKKVVMENAEAKNMDANVTYQ
jgi:hypothetical protein